MEGSIIYHFMIIFQHKTILRELAAQKTRRKKRKKRGGGTA
jgi:heme exporter protein D